MNKIILSLLIQQFDKKKKIITYNTYQINKNMHFDR